MKIYVKNTSSPHPLRDSEIDTVERNFNKANSKLSMASALRKAQALLLKPHSKDQEIRINQLILDIKSELKD